MGQNVEMPNFTQALYDARELAMERMQEEAEELQAEGIVGVQLTERSPRLGLARDRVLRDRHRDRHHAWRQSAPGTRPHNQPERLTPPRSPRAAGQSTDPQLVVL